MLFVGTNKLMVDTMLGVLTRINLFKTLSAGKGLQTYNFMKVCKGLPHFKGKPYIQILSIEKYINLQIFNPLVPFFLSIFIINWTFLNACARADLSTSAQRTLVAENMGICWELRNAAFFWGHNALNLIEQVNQVFFRLIIVLKLQNWTINY